MQAKGKDIKFNMTINDMYDGLTLLDEFNTFKENSIKNLTKLIEAIEKEAKDGALNSDSLLIFGQNITKKPIDEIINKINALIEEIKLHCNSFSALPNEERKLQCNYLYTEINEEINRLSGIQADEMSALKKEISKRDSFHLEPVEVDYDLIKRYTKSTNDRSVEIEMLTENRNQVEAFSRI